MTTSVQFITAEQLLAMPNDQRRELVKGELRTMAPAGFDHGAIIMRLARLMANHVEAHQLGVVVGAETGFKLARNPDTVRGADIGFVSKARIPAKGLPKGFWEGAPDLAVEVVSPGDRIDEVEEKVDDYLSAGAKVVWVVNPFRRTVTVYHSGETPVPRGEKETLEGGDVLPGFSCNVTRIFG